MSVRDLDQRTVDDSKMVSLTLYDQKGDPVETYFCRPTFDDGIMALRLAKRLQSVDRDDVMAMLDSKIPNGFIAKVRYFFRKNQGTNLDPVFHEIESFICYVFKNQFTRKQLAQGISTSEMIEVIQAITEKQRLKAPGLARPNGQTGQRRK